MPGSFHNLDILYFVVATDIICIIHMTALLHRIDTTAVIFHLQPVSWVPVVVVDGQHLDLHSIEGNPRAVIARLIGAHYVLRRCLGSRIRAAGDVGSGVRRKMGAHSPRLP